MRRPLYVTTSWDDGHPLDLRVAELLHKHNLKGTFYAPKTSQRATLTSEEVRDLAQGFELGGHTLHDVDLTTVDDATARQEIIGCRRWLEDTTGKPCSMFCFPEGRYDRRHLAMLIEAGFIGARTVELLSLDYPCRNGALMLAPTTVQAYPQPFFVYVKNAVRRARFRNLWTLLAHGRSSNWVRLAETLVAHAARRGGVFHLFGHSWEIEEQGLWSQLDDVLSYLGQIASDESAPVYCANGDLCRAQATGSR